MNIANNNDLKFGAVMSDKELKKSFDSIQKHFEEFHEKMLGKEARFNEFEEFEKLHDAVNSIFFDGFSRKENIEPELWNSIEAFTTSH